MEERYGLYVDEVDGEITQEQYDNWRYYYPEFDATQKRAKVMSQGLSDVLVDALKNSSDSI